MIKLRASWRAASVRLGRLGALGRNSELAVGGGREVDVVVALFVLHLDDDDLLQREGLRAQRGANLLIRPDVVISEELIELLLLE